MKNLNKYHFIEYDKSNSRNRKSCPDCGVELSCPCKSCAENTKGKLKEIWQENKEGIFQIKCPKCGFTASGDYWLDIDVEKAKKNGCWPSDNN